MSDIVEQLRQRNRELEEALREIADTTFGPAIAYACQQIAREALAASPETRRIVDTGPTQARVGHDAVIEGLGATPEATEKINSLKKEVNNYHRKYFDEHITLSDWQAHEYDNDYDDEVATENMKDQREQYKPIYPEVE